MSAKTWFHKICLFLFICFTLVGCYEGKVKAVSAGLKIGMSKMEMDHLVRELKFLKEQTITLYPNATETEMRSTFTHDQQYEYLEPEDLFQRQVSFDGNIKVFSYLIKESHKFAAPVVIDYLAIFYAQKEDKIIGWGHLQTMGEVESWGERF